VLLTFKERLVTITVSGVARLNETIKNQRRSAAGQKDFVPISGVPLPFDDNVAVVFEKGDDFLRRRDLFAMNHPPSSLVDDLAQQTDRAFQFGCKVLGFEKIKPMIDTELGNRRQGIAHNGLGVVQQILIGGLTSGLFATVENGHHAFFNHAIVIAVMVVRDRGQRLAGLEPAGDNPNAVG